MSGYEEMSGDQLRLVAALLDGAHEPIVGLDENGTVVHANAAAAGLFARKRSHVVGKPFVSLLDLDDRRRFRRAFAHAGDEPVEVQIALPGLGRVSAAVRALPGLIPRRVAVTVAVTMPAAAPAPTPGAAADISSALDRFFLRFPFAVIALGVDGRVVFANPRARQLLDATGTQLRIGRKFLPPGELVDITRRLLATPSAVPSETLRLNDRVLHAIGVGASRHQPAVLIFEDITRRHRQAQVMRDFVRNAAHQLRTPLTGIAAAVEVLQTGAKEDPVERDRFLTHIHNHSRRLIRIARGLLVLARAESGELPRVDVVEVCPLLQEIVQEVQPAPGVEVSVDCDSALAIIAEPNLAHEALAAILDNAVEHTKHGTIRLEAAQANGVVSVAVTDRGGGILPEHRERIFEPFYRPSAGGEGYGLGLAIAAQAAHAMGGALRVDDAPGGTRFTLELPSASRAQ